MSTPQTAQDTRRKRKAKDSSSGKHEAKRIRTQEEAVATGTPAVKSDVEATPSKDQLALTVAEGKKNVVKKAEGGQGSKSEKRRHANKTTWYTSEPAGGRFLQIEPVFSTDERYLMFSTAKAMHIHSVATSLLVRTLPMNTAHSISAYALSSADPDHLYVSDASGFVVLWDWVAGKKLARWNLASRIYGMATTVFEEADGSKVDTVYTCQKGEDCILRAHRLRGVEDGKEPEATAVLEKTTSKPLLSFSISGQGQVIAVAFKDSVLVGKAKGTPLSTLKDLSFVWREIRCTEVVTAIDVRAKLQESKEAKKMSQKGGSNSTTAVNLAIGCANGSVFVYEDIVHKLVQAEKTKKEALPSGTLAPRSLHWHRNAVATVKWSLDGNYVLSGGQETVLVLWQLETAKRQFLPHLTSAIDTLVVSPSGTSYAVQLADNSIIVLSTTELKPKANIAGVQSQILSSESTQTSPGTASRVSPAKDLLDEVYRTPAVIHPIRSSQVLLAVPASQPRTETSETHLPAPFLQTYDISSNHHVSRQALTRNNATIFNTGPNATKLREPDVKHLQLSHDGRWLATVEEWLPPADDVEHLATEKVMIKEEARARREVYLKFWLWNDEKETWMLETRIDAPHQFADRLISGRVFDLKYDSSSMSFATVGEDGFVRIWAPKIRLHDGAVVRGSKGEGLVTWSNRHSIRLETSVEGLDANSDIATAPTPVHARLAYSPDGSVLAATQEFFGNDSQGLVHFIDPASGSTRYSRGGLYSTGLVDIGFVDRQFIILSNSLSVWDLIDDELSYGYSILPLHLTRAQKAEMAHLAINHNDGTFAISLPMVVDHGSKQLPKKRQSKIVVLSPSSPRPIYSITVPCIVTALLPVQGSKGYVSLNTAAEIRVVAPKAAIGLQLVGPVAQAGESLAAFRDEEAAIESIADYEEGEELPDVKMLPSVDEMEEYEDVENDRPVVRPEQLASVFDVGPSFALPPVRDLFDAVVQLYARKPRAIVGAAA